MNTAEPTVEHAERAGIPRFLTHHSGTRGLRRLTPISRPPVTGHIGETFHVAAERHPHQLMTFDRPPDVDPTRPLRCDYADWAALVDEVAGWLKAAGVEPWDRVAIFKANHYDVLALASAAARIGAIPAPMAWTHPPEVIASMLERLERPVLVTDSERLVSGGLDEAVTRELTKVTICVDAVPDRPDLVVLDDLRGAPVPAPRLRANDDPMMILHTSGTTGPPKLVVHSATSIHAQGHVETERWPVIYLRKEDKVAFADPYFHTRVQTAVALFTTVTPRLLLLSDWDHDNVRRALRDFRPTVVETLPNIYLHWEPIARDPTRPFRDVRLYVNSFDAIHTRTIRTFLNASERRLPIWIQSWSQSECGTVAFRPHVRATVGRVGRRPPPTQFLGWPQPFVGKIRAVDQQTGAPLPVGSPGLIELSLPGRCLAYVGEQDRHDAKVDGEWWHTGDVGAITRSGGVRLLDREVDRIPGASCIELEDLLLDRLPQLTEAIVLGVPGRLPAAIVSTVGDAPLDEAAWRAATADMPPLADPIVIRWDEFPLTATWKVRRVELRERLFQAEPVGSKVWT